MNFFTLSILIQAGLVLILTSKVSSALIENEELRRFKRTDDTPKTLDILPTNECGMQSDNKIINGNITAIDEYPWMALLKYNTTKGLLPGCGGVLITKRHVLTAAHCIAGYVVKALGKVTYITLGEYDLEEKRDCDPGYGVPVCNEAIDVPIESMTVHPKYKNIGRRHDIAVVKLANDIAFTNFIWPICLPDKEIAESEIKADNKMFICGWGQYLKNDTKLSKFKRKASIKIVDQDDCNRIYLRNRITLVNDQVICAGGDTSDSCGGDSGGPLMAQFSQDFEYRYYALGLVSFGPQDCALKGVPAIYTNVYYYLDWIMETLQT